VGRIVLISSVSHFDNQSAWRLDEQRYHGMAGDGLCVHRQAQGAQPYPTRRISCAGSPCHNFSQRSNGLEVPEVMEVVAGEGLQDPIDRDLAQFPVGEWPCAVDRRDLPIQEQGSVKERQICR
jgi:hypothetical protein